VGDPRKPEAASGRGPATASGAEAHARARLGSGQRAHGADGPWSNHRMALAKIVSIVFLFWLGYRRGTGRFLTHRGHRTSGQRRDGAAPLVREHGVYAIAGSAAQSGQWPTSSTAKNVMATRRKGGINGDVLYRVCEDKPEDFPVFDLIQDDDENGQVDNQQSQHNQPER
jgi:hypothetical protein